jgi:hypothetical protein
LPRLPCPFRLLPYRGLSGGIPGPLHERPWIEPVDEVSGNQVTAQVLRPKVQWQGAAKQVTPRVTEQATEQVRRLIVGSRSAREPRRHAHEPLGGAGCGGGDADADATRLTTL